MARRVTFLSDCTVRLEFGDVGKIPRATIDYKAGYSGLIPEHHYASALKMGAVADGDAGQKQLLEEAESNSGSAPEGNAGRPRNGRKTGGLNR